MNEVPKNGERECMRFSIKCGDSSKKKGWGCSVKRRGIPILWLCSKDRKYTKGFAGGWAKFQNFLRNKHKNHLQVKSIGAINTKL